MWKAQFTRNFVNIKKEIFVWAKCKAYYTDSTLLATLDCHLIFSDEDSENIALTFNGKNFLHLHFTDNLTEIVSFLFIDTTYKIEKMVRHINPIEHWKGGCTHLQFFWMDTLFGHLTNSIFCKNINKYFWKSRKNSVDGGHYFYLAANLKCPWQV